MSLVILGVLFLIYRFRIRQLKARERRRQLHENLKQGRPLLPGKAGLSQPDREFIEELQQAIDKDLTDPDFNVTQLVRQLYMSRVTLYRKIYALTGETPVEFLNSCRLKKAAELLESNFGSVLEVALEVGFSSASYFTSCCKKKFGRLPTQYQEYSEEKET
jgi:AraC-like DNA-binding protein